MFYSPVIEQCRFLDFPLHYYHSAISEQIELLLNDRHAVEPALPPSIQAQKCHFYIGRSRSKSTTPGKESFFEASLSRQRAMLSLSGFNGPLGSFLFR
jgi:hypothetical protein